MDLEIKDFRGGPNENYNSADRSQYQKCENLLLNREGDLITRPGSVLYDSTHPQLPSGNNRVGLIVNYNKDESLLVGSVARLFNYSAGWSELIGPTGNTALVGTTANSRFNVAEWKKHLFITSSDQTPPAKVYKDQNGNFQVTSAGLPAIPTPNNFVTATALASAITLANLLRADLLAHFSNVTAHFSADTVSAAMLTSGASTNLPTLLTLVGQMNKAFTSHINDALLSSPVYHSVIPPNAVENFAYYYYLNNTTAPTDIISAVAALNDLLAKYNFHMISVDSHRANLLTQETTPQINGVNSGIQAPQTLAATLNAANKFKSNLNAHLADLTQHVIADPFIVSVPNATDLPSLIFLINSLAGIYSIHRVDADKSSAWTYHYAKDTTTSDVPPAYLFQSGGGLRSNASLLTCVTELAALINLFNLHEANGGPHNSNGGLHQCPDNPPVCGGYLYGFVYSYTYQSGSLTFEVESFVTEVQVNTATPNQDPQLITNIPPLVNFANSNWDTTNVKVKIFRSIINGNDLFYLDSIPNGTTSYTDTISDASLIGNGGATIYTAGGVVDNDVVPNAKFVHVINNVGYWGNFVLNGTSYPNRILQSIPGAIDSVPGSFFIDLPQECLGISSVSGNVITWTAHSTYRLEGEFDSLGNGQIKAVPISDEIGMVASYSPIQTDGGIMFLGNDGFYFTNGFEMQRITRDWLNTYLNLVSNTTKASQIHGVLDRLTKRIWWVTSVAGGENDTAYILDLNLPVNSNMVFTTAVGGANFAPSAIGFYNNQIIRGDSRGYVFVHDPSYPADPKVDLAVTPSLWNIVPVIYNFISAGFDFGTNTVKKFTNIVLIKAKNLGNLSLQIIGINDDGRTVGYCTPVRSRKAIGTGLIEEKRHFPSGTLRCQSKQIQLTNANVVITNSDTIGQATLVRSTKTLTLLSGSWPVNLSDQTVSFVNDGYTNKFTIVSQSGGSLVVSDPSNLLPVDGTYKWQINGIPKDEFAQIINFVVFYEFLSSEQTSAVAESGTNK